jgi:hypothetical protein
MLLLCVLMLFWAGRELATGSSFLVIGCDLKRSEDPLLFWIVLWGKVVLSVGLMLCLLAKVVAPQFYFHYLARPL